MNVSRTGDLDNLKNHRQKYQQKYFYLHLYNIKYDVIKAQLTKFNGKVHVITYFPKNVTITKTESKFPR